MSLSDITFEMLLVNYFPMALIMTIANYIQPIEYQIDDFVVIILALIISFIMVFCEQKIIKYLFKR